MMSKLTREQKSWKTLTRKLTDAVGGSKHCSELLDGKSASLISAYGNPEDTSEYPRFMPLDDIVTLERMAGRSVIGEWLVAQVERDPDRERRTVGLDDLSMVAKEGGEAKSALAVLIGKALALGGFDKVSATDRTLTLKEAREVHAAWGRIIESLEDQG